jgi:hypothetical protein
MLDPLAQPMDLTASTDILRLESLLRELNARMVPRTDDKVPYLDGSSETLHAGGGIEIFGTLPSYRPMSIAGGSSAYSSEQKWKCQIPIYLVQPQHLRLGNHPPLSQLYLTFRDTARERIRNGTPLVTCLGPEQVCVTLLFRAREPHDPWDAHGWACEVMKLNPGFEVFSNIAAVVQLTRLMQASWDSRGTH